MLTPSQERQRCRFSRTSSSLKIRTHVGGFWLRQVSRLKQGTPSFHCRVPHFWGTHTYVCWEEKRGSCGAPNRSGVVASKMTFITAASLEVLSVDTYRPHVSYSWPREVLWASRSGIQGSESGDHGGLLENSAGWTAESFRAAIDGSRHEPESCLGWPAYIYPLDSLGEGCRQSVTVDFPFYPCIYHPRFPNVMLYHNSSNITI